jgi:hypothetical protein
MAIDRPVLLIVPSPSPFDGYHGVMSRATAPSTISKPPDATTTDSTGRPRKSNDLTSRLPDTTEICMRASPGQRTNALSEHREEWMAKKTKDDEGKLLTDLTKSFTRGKALLVEFRALFPEARALPKEDRRRSRGKLGVKEGTALRGVLDAVDLEPAMFASLADEDEGHDSEKLETNLLRERFDCHPIYKSLADEMEALGKLLSDAALTHAALCKPVTLAAYEIAKPVSKRNPAVREKLAPLIDYYGANAAAAVETRQANKAAKK